MMHSNYSGWDDDDDALDQIEIDLSSSSSPGHPVEPSTQSTQRVAPPLAQDTIPMGQGLFVGRLTRFLESVTQPSEEAQLPPPSPEQPASHLQPYLLSSAPPLYAPPVLVPARQSNSVQQQSQSQWTDAPDAPPTAFQLQQRQQQSQEREQDSSAWDMEEDYGDELRLDDEPVALEQQEDGWGGVDDSLDAMLQSTTIQDALQEPPNTPRSTNRGRRVRTSSTSGGWDDDNIEDALEGLDDDVLLPTSAVPPAAEGTSSNAGWDLDDDNSHDMLDRMEHDPTLPELSGSGWGEDGLLDDLEMLEDQPEVVDHVPSGATPRIVVSRSVRSVPGSAAEDERDADRTNVDDEFDPDKVEFGHVVDVVPESQLTSPGVVSRTASMAVQPGDPNDILDDADGWDDDIDVDLNAIDTNDQEEKPDESREVDHVPEDMSLRRLDQSASTASIRDEESADFLDENDKTFGPVVSRLPSSRTTSEVAVSESVGVEAPVEEMDTDVTENGWDADDALDKISTQDADQPKEGDKAVVDHLPSMSGGVSRSVSTTSVPGDQSSEVLQQDDDPDRGDYGLRVVDHLPSQASSDWPHRGSSTAVQASTGSSASNSGIVANGGLTREELREEAVVDHVPVRESSGTITLGGSTAVAVASQRSIVAEDAWENDDLEPKPEDFLQVVDHTPPTPRSLRISSRASPSIAAQAPIEEMDEDDDYIDDEDFGPVLDHLPTLQQSTGASVTESMAVQAAPSEVDDDDDMDDRVPPVPEQDERSEGYEGRDDDSSEAPLMTATDGNKEETLVDHVPKRSESRPTDASTIVVVDPSESSTVGDITCEDRFMPVVDHTPALSSLLQPSAAGSTLENATISEFPDDDDLDDTIEGAKKHDAEEVQSVGDDGTIPTVDGAPPSTDTNVVDHVPRPESAGIRRINSETTLTIGQSVVSREEIYGNVVDHLPSQHSLERPSLRRDGSMAVQATPSELANDDMDDDPELSKASTPSLRTADREMTTRDDEQSSGAVAPTSSSKALSVTFSSPIKISDTHCYDVPPVDESMYYDAHSPEADSFVDVESAQDAVQCMACDQATTVDCPCVRSILNANWQENGMTTTVMTPEGVAVQVDVKKLLQQEITRRLLLEKELDGCKIAMRKLEERAECQTEIDGLHMNLVEELQAEQILSSNLRTENAEVEAKLNLAQKSAAELERERTYLVSRETELASEVERILKETESKIAQSSSDKEVRVKSLQSRVDELEEASQSVQGQLEAESKAFRLLEKESAEQKQELLEKQNLVDDLNEQQGDWERVKIVLERELSELRQSIKLSPSAASLETELSKRVASLESELASRSLESETLKEELSKVRQRLNQSEAQNFVHMKESTRLSRHHSQEAGRLSDTITALEKESIVLMQEKEQVEKEMSAKLDTLRIETASLKQQKLELQQRNEAMHSAKMEQVQEHNLLIKQKLVDARSLEAKVKGLEDEKARFCAEIQHQAMLLQQSESSVSQVAVLIHEKETLEASLHERVQEVRSLQEQLAASASADEGSFGDLEEQLGVMTQERRQLQDTLDRYERDLEATRSAIEIHLDEKDSLRQDLNASRKTCKDLEASLQSMKQNAADLEAKLIHSEKSISSVQTDLNSAYEGVVNDRSRLAAKCKALEKRAAGAEASEKQDAELSKERELMITRVQDELERSKQENLELSFVNDKLHRMLEEVQESVLQSEASQVSNAEHTIDQNGLHSHHRDLALENESLVQKGVDLEDMLAAAHAEKQKLIESLRESEAKQKQLNADLDVLINERETILLERDTFEDENEEMLVQLGLVKQQLDGHEEEVRAIQATVESKEAELKATEHRLRDTEKMIRQLEQVGVGNEHGARSHLETISTLERRVRELSGSKTGVVDQLEQAESSRKSATAQLERLSNENVALSQRLSVMESEGQNASSLSETKELEHQALTGSLEERCQHLDEVCTKQQEELDHLASRLHQASSSQSTREQALQEEVSRLERACGDHERIREEREIHLQKLRLQLEDLSKKETNSEEVRVWQGRVAEAEQTANQHLENLRAAQTELEQTKIQLQRTTERLSTTETALLDLELDMDVRDQGASERDDLETRLRDAESRLEEKSRLVNRLSSTRHDTMLHPTSTASETASEHGAAGQSTTSASEISPEQLQSLQSQLETLRQDYQTATTSHQAREETTRRTVSSLNGSIVQHKDRISSLEMQLQSLSIELSTCQEQLVSKESEFRRVSIDLEETRSQQLHSTQQATSQVLEVSSKEEAESIEHMRTHIISLAMALERSEQQRAEAIDRLLKDRKVHADSLRRLGESVKRFYSTLSCSE